MKGLYFAFLGAGLLTMAAACGPDTDAISAAAQGYLDAMGNYRPADARPYASKETCEITLSFFESLMQHTDPAVYADNMPATITLGEISVEDDTLARVAFHKSTPVMEQDDTLHLVCRRGRWQVHEVIVIPKFLQPDSAPRTFTDEEIAAMRRQNQAR